MGVFFKIFGLQACLKRFVITLLRCSSFQAYSQGLTGSLTMINLRLFIAPNTQRNNYCSVSPIYTSFLLRHDFLLLLYTPHATVASFVPDSEYTSMAVTVVLNSWLLSKALCNWGYCNNFLPQVQSPCQSLAPSASDVNKFTMLSAEPCAFSLLVTLL